MIEIHDLTKKYGQHTAVDHVTLTVRQNEILGFLGPNGAGKSTTMNVITGYLSATEGTVTVDGADILEQPLQARAKIGYLPEIPPLYKDLTVNEYLSFVYGLKKCKKNKREHLDEILAQTGLLEQRDRLIANLSKGYQQRVGIAQALVNDPPVLILDEPTVGLDPAQIVEIRNLIKKLGESHTVILSTHILSEAQLICDRIVVIYHGKIIADERTEVLVRRMSDDHCLYAQILGEPERVMKVLNTLSDVKHISKTADGYAILQEEGKDVRVQLFHLLAENDLPLLGLRYRDTTLEQAFLGLTAREEAGNA